MGRKGLLLTIALLFCLPAPGICKTKTDVAVITDSIQGVSETVGSASCIDWDTDRPYGDLNCDGIKGVGEEYLDSTGGSGDITAVGDVASGAAFNGTQGSTFTLVETGGDILVAPQSVVDTSGGSLTISAAAGNGAAANGGDVSISAGYGGGTSGNGGLVILTPGVGTGGGTDGYVDIVGAVRVQDEAYGAGWDTSTSVPTKNAVYDKIESWTETDPLALLTAGTDNVKDTHIDWGSGAAQVDLSDIPTTTVGSPTVDTVGEERQYIGSAGFYSGCSVTASGTAGAIDISDCEGMIRTSASATAPIINFKVAAATALAIPANTLRYVYVDYNAGTPQFVLNSSYLAEAENYVLIGGAVNDGGTITTQWNEGVQLEESIGQAGRFLRHVFRLIRDEFVGGLAIGNIGTRNLTLSAGTLWRGRTDYSITAKDTSAASTFTYYYRDGAGGFTKQLSQTQWNNTQYDDGSGTLATLGVNKYANAWVYITADDKLHLLYGRAQYNSLADAQAGTPPTTTPNIITGNGVLAARLTFQKSASTPTISSAFSTQFSPTTVTEHSDLAGLTDDDHTQYLLSTGDSGDFSCTTRSCGIDANAVALATDTTGNYVATLADSGASEITVTGSGSENAAVTLALASGITRDTEWDTEGEVQTAWGSVNILLETEIDASSELRALMDDETGTGLAVFGTQPTLLNVDVKNGATSSGVLAIYEDSDNGTNKATFQVPALAADTAYILPADDGSSGEVLSTNGSGTLDWIAAAAASGWTDNGTTLSTTTDGDSVIIGGATAVGTSGTSVLMIESGTAPTTSPADAVQLYSKDGSDTTNVMLHMNGSDASTTFTDSSATANTCTANGNAQIDTAQSKFGGASGLFDGNDYVNIPDAAWMDYGTGAFTVECWLRFTSLSGSWNYFLNDANTSTRISLRWRSNTLETFIASTLNSFAWTPSNSVWYHLAFTRSGTSVRAFVDGTQIGSTGSSSDNITGTAAITVGTNPALDGLVGWMDDFRMMSTAAYTANFTAPSAELPNSSAAAELTVRDEAGNTTTLSPHNFEGMPSEALQNVRDASNLPVTIHHTSPDGMTEQWIDLAGLAMKVEQLTGESLIHTRIHAPRDASGKPLFTLDEAKTLLAAEHPEVDQTELSDKEIYRRATWVKAKVKKEAELHLEYESKGRIPPPSPKWMEPFLEVEKKRKSREL